MTLKASQYQKAVIAVNRFGLGARPGELAKAALNPEGWLLGQMTKLELDSQLASTESALRQFAAHREMQKQRRDSPSTEMMSTEMVSSEMMSTEMMSTEMKSTTVDDRPKSMQLIRQTQKKLFADGLWQAVETSQPFSTRLLDFFSNHFSVSTSMVPLYVLAPLLEREAIAPNLFEKFEDMLIAVVKHPAMLIYLDNTRSTGPNSKVGRNNKKRGLNENLAREIFELHTLGIDGGYRIGDIQELAKAISGWSVSRPAELGQDGFVYRDRLHEPGTRTILGKRYRREGERQGEAILIDLARHPATAGFVSQKLARYFVSDEPDMGLVDAMSKTWRKTNGNLRAVITTLIEHDSSWTPERKKFKTPREFMVSTLRAIDAKRDAPQRFYKGIVNHLTAMGQAPFRSGSPAGYSLRGEAWAGSDALMKRIDWVNRLNVVSPIVNASALQLSKQLFADNLSDNTLRAIKRAESARQARTLLFMSPEFQRR